MKKIIAVALALCMIVPMMCFSASADTITPDTDWYNASDTEFVINTAAELYGFATISATNNFAGKTIKLGADITINEGDADVWASKTTRDDYLELELTEWVTIKNFAGTFDGQGHVISGLAYFGSAAGMFAAVNENAVIKNFSLVNSYFGNTGAGAGGVAYGGGGTFENIYSDANVYSGDHHAGGIFGVASKPVTVKNSWFDGSVVIVKRYAAGIVGNGNGQPVVIENCLNSGTIYTSYEGSNSHIGGMCGRNDSFTTIKNCLNTGKVATAYTEAGQGDAIGGIFGACSQSDKTKGGLTIENSWSTIESCPYAVATTGPANDTPKDANLISASLINAYGGYNNTTLDFENVWAVNLDGAPLLQIFAETIPALYKVNNPVITDYEVKADGFYGPRWYVEVKVPEGMKKEDIKLGLLVTPTKAIPNSVLLNTNETSYTYRDVEYKVANVEATVLRESDDNTILASFVITDLVADNARMNFTVRPYAVYTVAEGEIEVYGDSATATFYKDAVLESKDSATAADKKALLDAVLAPIYEGLGGEFPVYEQWTELDSFEEIPPYVAEGVIIGEAENYGPEHPVAAAAGQPTNVVMFDYCEDQHYWAYIELLKQYGFEVYYTNGEAGFDDAVYTTVFTKGGLVVTLTQISYQFQMFLTATWDMPLSEHMFDNFADTAIEGAQDTLHMLEMFYWGNSYVIKLKNGHFLVHDGATDYEWPYLMEYLQDLAGEGNPVIIEAWFVSHLHYDHFCAIRGVNDHPEFMPEEFYVEGFYINFPGYQVNQLDKGVYNEYPGELSAISKLKTTKGETPKIYRPMSGQTYYFCDLKIEVPISQEQIHISEYKGGFNDSSTWYKHYFNIGDGEYQTFLLGGDSHQGGMAELIADYSSEYLSSDIFSTLHHASNTWDAFTDYLEYKTILSPSRTISVSGANARLNEKALANGGEVVCEGDGNVVLTFPYAVGEYEQKHVFTWNYASLYGKTNGVKI